jgi:hypothetical protein
MLTYSTLPLAICIYFRIVGLIALRMAEDWMLDSTIIMLLQVY